MRLTISMLVAVLAAAAGHASAQTPAPPAPATEVSGVTVQGARLERVDTPDQMMRGRSFNPNDRVCRSIVATGSRLGARRVCRTRAEWEAQSAEDRQAADQVTRQTRVPGG